LQEAKLDPSAISQGDGAGGDWADLFTPTSSATISPTGHAPRLPSSSKPYPSSARTDARQNQTANPGAGHVFAKTGTFASEDRLNANMMLKRKGLAGYVITPAVRNSCSSLRQSRFPAARPRGAQSVAGQALGEIAAAAYDARSKTLPRLNDN